MRTTARTQLKPFLKRVSGRRETRVLTRHGGRLGPLRRVPRGENRRPLVSAVIPKPGREPAQKPGYASGADGNPRPVIDQLQRWAETHEFLGEAIPFYYLEFAADHFAALLGADLVFRPNEPGAWAVPFVKDLSGAEIRFRPEEKWWRRTVEFAEALRQRCGGALMIASPTLVDDLDAFWAQGQPAGS